MGFGQGPIDLAIFLGGYLLQMVEGPHQLIQERLLELTGSVAVNLRFKLFLAIVGPVVSMVLPVVED